MSRTFVEVELVSHTCGECGVLFGLEADFYRRKLADKTVFYCPNGHNRVFLGKSDEQKRREAERRAERAEARATHERDQRQAAERSASAYKGVATRLRNRVVAGRCPVPDGCDETFPDLGAHLAEKHPGFVVTEGALADEH